MLEFDQATPWRELPFVSVDVETTGLDAASCRVIEVGIVRFERGQVAERWGSLIDPGEPIPEKLTELTGITDAMVQGQPSFRDLKWEIYGRLKGRLFVAYNAAFDRGFLQAEMTRVGLTLPDTPVLDPLVWSRELLVGQRRHKLGAICDKLGIPLENAHRAVDDAEAAGRVLLRFADKVAPDLRTLLEDQQRWIDAQEAAFAERRAAKEAKQAPDEPEEEAPQAGLFG